jgi:putative nucleotidyltransferase with HDIG domain
LDFSRLVRQVSKGKQIFQNVFKIGQELKLEVYAVGGFVRDLYLGKEGTDIDFVVVGDALKLASEFKKKYKTSKVVTFPRFGTAKLLFRKFKLEFVTARSEHYHQDSRKPKVIKADLESDLSRRDFTINTLAMNISPESFGEVCDLYDGITDIENRIIRTPLDPALTFSDDPLRILRAIRFATTLDFQLEKNILQAISETRERLGIISQERITEEFQKILLAAKPSIGLKLLKDTALLEIIFPELVLLSGVEQRQDFHHKDVFEHTLQVLDKISENTDKFELRMAALLHDIAKPQTKRFNQEAGWTFHGHEEIGARMVNKIAKRMRFPTAIVKYLEKMVRLHLRPMQLVDKSVTDSAIRRLMVEAGELIDDLMMLCRADITSKNPQKVKRFLGNFDLVEKKMKAVEEKDKISNFQLAINGNIIMKTLNIPSGPVVGKIKKTITDAVLDGEIPNEPNACFQYMMSIKDQFIAKEKDNH